MKDKLKKWICAACTVGFMLSASPLPPVSADGATTPTAAGSSPAEDGSLSYAEYLAQYAQAEAPEASMHIAGGSGVASAETAAVAQASFEGKSDVLIWKGETGTVTWTFTSPAAGLYCLDMLYYALPGKGSQVELALSINGTTPFRGAEKFRFSRIWKDDLEPEAPFAQDALGNQLSPRQIEVFDWQQSPFSDQEGFYSEPLRFYFREGENTITLTCLREELAIAELLLYQPKPLPSYEAPQQGGGAPAGYIQHIQAERATRKSDASLRADYDKADPLTEPSAPNRTLQNIIGGSRWASQGQWIEWTFTVPSSGYYRIGLRYRQNAVRGFFTTRRVRIDGEIPYAGLDAVRFSYGKDWSWKALGDGEDALFYFEEGVPHTIRLEVTTGTMGEMLLHLQDDQHRLSELYRRIIMITGKNPDLYRDYELEREIPGLLDTMLNVSESLKAEAGRMEAAAGFSGSEAAILYRLSEQLASLVADPYSIPQRLGNLGDNISALAAWIMNVKGQPLELDYLAVMSPDAAAPATRAGFWQKLLFGVQAFIGSFFTDYNSIGTAAASEDGIEVWMGTGNEQMSILGRMIDAGFTAETGVPVRLKLVSSTLLLQAIMADVGPDVAINVTRTDPINLAMRGALEPLDGYEGFAEAASRFMPTAMEPYLFYGSHYALPDTQIFNMMFCRTDIFADLGLTPPETWEDLYKIAPILQRNNMDIGMPASAFNMLLLQRGGSYYNAEKTAMAFDSDEAAESFVQWVEFYTQYGYPLFKDDYTRFRTGEMPLTLMPYNFYSQLVAAAPEIRSLWAMYPIPGTRAQDGTVRRTDSATGTACILLAGSRRKEQGWRFLDWWTSAETQTNYCLELEAVMGMVARYPTANVEAFGKLPWTAAEREILTMQWSHVTELPEVPGGYYVGRNIDNAFRACVYRGENPLEALRYWTRETDKEIRRKLNQYHLGPQ